MINQEERALELLGEVRDIPDERAKRIAGIYACFYLEDPLLFVWHGLACFVARQIFLALDTKDIGFAAFMGKGNKGIYQTIVGATLSFRDQQPVTGPLHGAFKKLDQAQKQVMTSLPEARQLVEDATLAICIVEQTDILQNDYAALELSQEQILRYLFCFRLGMDPSAPVLKFTGDQPSDLEQRLEWTQNVILPAWNAWRTTSPEWVRAEVERIRRWSGVKASLIP